MGACASGAPLPRLAPRSIPALVRSRASCHPRGLRIGLPTDSADFPLDTRPNIALTYPPSVNS